ncbi:MAG TPA: glycosyltransferase [Pyrinomonadaceae bacterium]|nr:glycosyltransferase [Pyrinomonadaceae bacterium]
MKKRILQFIGSFHQGGSERQATALSCALKAEGTHDIYVATLNNDGVLRADMHAAGFADIPEFPLTSFFNANFVRQVRSCAAYLKDNKIDLVQTHDFYTNVFGMTAASLAGVKAKAASKRETGGMRSSSQEFVEKLAFGRADAIVSNSVAVRDHLTTRGISANKVNVIYNGIDVSRFENAESSREKFGLPTDENIRFVTLVANLRHAVKNVPMFLRAAKRVADALPNTHFVIAGEGELETELKAMATELGIFEQVHFIGRCSDVPSLLSPSCACVLTSTAEGFSNSILEYMAAARPVVATNVGGAAEAVVEGETGYLVASDNDAKMAEHLIGLLNDDAKAAAFGNAGREMVREKFSIDAQLRNTLRLYNSLLDK